MLTCGRLPPGEHVASWDEVVERFGWTERRRRLLDGLAEAIELLAEAGCRKVWLNGSFVTAKDEPGDFDACWDTDDVDLDALDPALWTCPTTESRRRRASAGNCSRTSSKPRSGLSFAEFLQNERDTSRKGIVVIDLSKGVAS